MAMCVPGWRYSVAGAKGDDKVHRKYREWKRRHINFEPSRSCAVNTRFQQYLDIMLLELGVSPYRKMPNLFAEIFVQYGAPDYRHVFEEYFSQAGKRNAPLPSLPIHT